MNNGTAELTGTVADQFQRDETLRLVQGVPGVERVQDRLVQTGAIRQAQDVEVPSLDAQAPKPPMAGTGPARRSVPPGSCRSDADLPGGTVPV